MEEGEWIRRFQHGETEYLTPLIEQHYAGIQQYCFWRIRDAEEAKDLTQETFYRFCRHIERYTDAGKCRAYLYTIARHLCIDHMRNGQAPSWDGEARDAGSTPQPGSSIEDQVERELLVHELLGLLPEGQRELVFMRFCLDLTFRDIARVTGVNVCMVQYRVKRGLAVLRSHLERSEPVEEQIRASRHQCPKELPHAPR